MSIAPNVHSAAAYLLRFDEPKEVLPAFEGILEMSVDAVVQCQEAPDEQEDAKLEALRRDYEHLRALHEEQQQTIQLAIEEARREWIAEQGKLLSEKLMEALACGFESIRSDICRALAPFISQEICELSVSELIIALRHAVAGSESRAIRIEGPKDFLEGFKVSAIADGVECEIIENDSTEINVIVNTTRIESCISDWCSTIRAATENA